MSAPAINADLQVLDELLVGMSLEAQRALLWRGFGRAIPRRMHEVERLDVRTASAARLASWLAPLLHHAGLDASMLELFHVVGGVSWERCHELAARADIVLTLEPPRPAAPAELDPEAVVLTLAAPSDRQPASTRSLLRALQGVHRRLEEDPARRRPSDRPLLVGISDDDRHLVLRVSPGTRAALARMSVQELSEASGLPVRALGTSARPPDHSLRPVVVALTLCAMVLLMSLVARQVQLRHQTDRVAEAHQQTALAMSEVTLLREEVRRAEAVAVAAAEPEPEPTVQGLTVEPPVGSEPRTYLEEPDWLPELSERLKATGASVEHSDGRVSVAFSEELLVFEPGEASLAPKSRRSVAPVSAFLKQHPSILVWVEGHTDDAAYSSGNWLLGARRALAVVQALTQAGVSPRRVVLTSHGEHRPVAPNTTAEGRQKNRRVELVLASEARVGG